MAESIRELAARLAGSTEALAALGAALRLRVSGERAPAAVHACLEEVADALGARSLLDEATPEELSSVLAPIRAVLLQSVDLITDPTRAPGFSYTDPELLQSQGQSSAVFAEVIEQVLVPRIAGFGESLSRPGASFLDVGVGVGALTAAMCQTFPNLRVVGIDPWDYVLSLAQRNIVVAGLEQRVELRRQALQELDDLEVFDLVSLAAANLPRDVIEGSLGRVRSALRPGGWAVVAVERGGAALEAALARLRTARAGGALLDLAAVEQLLEEAGFDPVEGLAFERPVPGALAVGRRAS